MKQQQLSTFNCLIGLQLALVVALVRAQDPVKITTSTIDLNVASTTSAPALTSAPVSSATAALIGDLNKALESGTKKSLALNSELGIVVNIVGPSTTAAPSSVVNSSTTIVTVNATDPQTTGGLGLVSVSSTTSTTSKPVAPLETTKQQDKLDKYFAPICDSIAKLTPKQMFKVQSQMKQFVEKMDPNLNPVSKPQLESICAARKQTNDSAGPFEAFKSCVSTNWDPQLDKQLDEIAAARAKAGGSLLTNTKTAANGTDLTQDDGSDEISLIGDVVGNVLAANNESTARSDIKVIDIVGPNVTAALFATGAPKLSSDLPAATTTTTSAPSNKLTIGEETKDESNGSKQSADKSIGVTSASSNGTKSTTIPSGVQIEQSTTVATPGSAITTTISGNTTEAPAAQTTGVVSTVAPTLTSILVEKLLKTSKKSTGESTTASPAIKEPSSTTKSPTATSTTTTGKPLLEKLANAATEIKPLESIQDMLKRQEKQKQEFESKLKAEREKLLKQMKKKQDELDAKNAIKALQVQKSATNGHQTSHSDARMHQIEHERQMAIDPIGHTIKHQQYEFNKQQRALKMV